MQPYSTRRISYLSVEQREDHVDRSSAPTILPTTMIHNPFLIRIFLSCVLPPWLCSSMVAGMMHLSGSGTPRPPGLQVAQHGLYQIILTNIKGYPRRATTAQCQLPHKGDTWLWACRRMCRGLEYTYCDL